MHPATDGLRCAVLAFDRDLHQTHGASLSPSISHDGESCALAVQVPDSQRAAAEAAKRAMAGPGQRGSDHLLLLALHRQWTAVVRERMLTMTTMMMMTAMYVG